MNVFSFVLSILVGRWRELKGIPVEASLNSISDGEGTIKDFFAVFLSVCLLAGIHVLIQDVPNVIGEIEVLQQAGKPNKHIVIIWKIYQERGRKKRERKNDKEK